MPATATNPDGLPQQCSICGNEIRAWPSAPLGDAPCPRCGSLLMWFRDEFEQRLGVELHAADDHEKALADLRIDSLDLVELVMELEDEFGITIPDEERDRLRTVRDLIRFIRRRQDEQSALDRVCEHPALIHPPSHISGRQAPRAAAECIHGDVGGRGGPCHADTETRLHPDALSTLCRCPRSSCLQSV